MTHLEAQRLLRAFLSVPEGGSLADRARAILASHPGRISRVEVAEILLRRDGYTAPERLMRAAMQAQAHLDGCARALARRCPIRERGAA